MQKKVNAYRKELQVHNIKKTLKWEANKFTLKEKKALDEIIHMPVDAESVINLPIAIRKILPSTEDLLNIPQYAQKPSIRERKICAEFRKSVIKKNSERHYLRQNQAVLRKLISASRDAIMLRLATIRVKQEVLPVMHNRINRGDHHERILFQLGGQRVVQTELSVRIYWRDESSAKASKVYPRKMFEWFPVSYWKEHPITIENGQAKFE